MTNNLRRDPTRLTTLRRSTYTQVRRRLAGLRILVRNYLTSVGLLGSSIQKVEQFQRWLQLQVDNLLDQQWLQGISQQAWVKGVVRSYDDARKRFLNDRVAHLGAKQEFLRRLHVNSLSTSVGDHNPMLVVNQDPPAAVSEAVDLLARRLGMEFQAVFASILQEAARVLLDGLIADDSVATIAADVARVLGDKLFNRLKRVVATELTRAHASGQLTALRQLGVDSVTALVEWDASSDACPKCAELDGDVMTLEDAEGLIPIHPYCVCAWVPAEPSATED